MCETNQFGPMLVNIEKDLKLFYLNSLSPNGLTREDPARSFSFRVSDDHMDSDHYSIQISADKAPKRNIPLTEPRYKLDKTENELFHKTLQDSLNPNIDANDELEEFAVTLCDNLIKAVNSSTAKVYSHNDSKTPISRPS